MGNNLCDPDDGSLMEPEHPAVYCEWSFCGVEKISVCCYCIVVNDGPNRWDFFSATDDGSIQLPFPLLSIDQCLCFYFGSNNRSDLSIQ